jgi:hypothetical protein
MSENQSSTPGGEPSKEQMMTALFAQLVMQQANLAMMLLGKVAHPESGKVVKDLESARLFIDQLEMLEVKTRGNLSKEEAGLLKQSLMNLRLAFVEAVEAPESTPTPKAPEPAATAGATPDPSAGAPAAEDEEHRKKFSKKY